MDHKITEFLRNQMGKVKKPKKQHKAISGLLDFYDNCEEKDNLETTIQELRSQKGPLSEEVVKLLQNKEELEQNVATLQQEKTSLQKSRNELNKEVDNLQPRKDSLFSSISDLTNKKMTLTQEKKEIEEALNPLREEIAKLTTQNEEAEKQKEHLLEKNTSLNKENRNLKDEISKRSKDVRELRSETTKLKEEKTFYAETLSGHKKETNKIFWINVVAILLAIMGFSYFSYIVFNFYENALKQISESNDNYKTLILFFSRGGAGVILYYIMKYFLSITGKMLSEMYSIFKEIRDIESRLILAREVTFSTEKDIPFESDEDRRKYLSYLKGLVLKDYFLNNMNSLKKEIKENTQKDEHKNESSS